MRTVLATALTAAAVAWGCSRKQPEFPPTGTTPSATAPGAPGTNVSSGQKLIVTPEIGLTGKVLKVNPNGRFVVLSFPLGHLPALDQRLNVYHLGLKVGEVKVGSYQLDDLVVADVVAGDAAVGDEAREQ